MTIRLKDIANELGLSVVTISKVLRDHPDIGAETRKRVLKRMRELNYQPNLAARSLVTRADMDTRSGRSRPVAPILRRCCQSHFVGDAKAGIQPLHLIV